MAKAPETRATKAAKLRPVKMGILLKKCRAPGKLLCSGGSGGNPCIPVDNWLAVTGVDLTGRTKGSGLSTDTAVEFDCWAACAASGGNCRGFCRACDCEADGSISSELITGTAAIGSGVTGWGVTNVAAATLGVGVGVNTLPLAGGMWGGWASADSFKLLAVTVSIFGVKGDWGWGVVVAAVDPKEEILGLVCCVAKGLGE